VTATAPADPFATDPPPPVIARYRAADGRAELTLRAPVWLEGSWWTCLDRSFRAGAGFLAPHRHDATDEVHFVRDGTVRYVHRHRLRRARAGDVLVIPAGSVHSDPWATRAGAATVTTLLRPAAPEWLAFGLRLGRLTREGPLTRRGQPPLAVVMDLVQQSGADVLAAGLPAALQRRVTTPILAAIGRSVWSPA
jgi:mannose-6-phosphate isomerase-like protein (cupin superfamily)